jgi:hypothetical protein
MKNCHCHTDIPRDGSGQLTRFLKALDPAYARIDDRSFADLMIFASRYAEKIRFFKLSQDVCADENWSTFFRKDLTVLAASVAQFNLDQIRKDYTQMRDDFEGNPAIVTFKKLFEPILHICGTLDKWAYSSVQGFPLRTDIELAIASTLRKQVLGVLILDKSAMLINNGFDLDLKFEPEDDTVWNLQKVEILLNTNLFAGTKLRDQLFNASLEIDTIFHACFGVISDIVGHADDYLAFSIEQYPRHQPHMALFIAFLQLFKLAQEQLNGLTEKHLNHYYRDILHLTEKPAQPDHVNLIFELAKGTDIFAMAKGTQLSAGKDALGIEQIYETDRDMLLNRAQVKEIKNVFINKNEEKAEQMTFFARPVANSEDGLGTDFRGADVKWNAFGVDTVKKQSACGDIRTEKPSANFAQIGFAIASPQLRLQGGNRKIELKINRLSELLVTPLNEGVKVLLSGEKGWMEVKPRSGLEGITKTLNDFNNFSTAFETGFYLEGDTIHIFLPVKEQGIVNYDPKLHSDYVFNTSTAVLQILLVRGTDINTTMLDSIRLDGITSPDSTEPNFLLKVFVGSMGKARRQNDTGFRPDYDGLTQLVFQNNDSLLNTDTFFPFGNYPAEGSSFYIGSEEVFNKSLAELSVDIDWMNTSLRAAQRFFDVDILQGKVFRSLRAGSENPDIDPNMLLNDGDFSGGRFDELESVTQYVRGKTNRGFLRISIHPDNGLQRLTPVHGEISLAESAVTRMTSEQRFNFGLETKARGASLSYRAVITSLYARTDQFFHVYPFGNAEIAVKEELPGKLRVTIRYEIDFKRVSGRVAMENGEGSPGVNILIDSTNRGTITDANGKFVLEEVAPEVVLGISSIGYESIKISVTETSAELAPSRTTAETRVGFQDDFAHETKADGSGIIPLHTFSILPNFRYGQNLTHGSPPFSNQYTGANWQEGNLYIGIENLNPPQNLSLLFQVAAGTGMDDTVDLPKVHWSYLSNNQWKPLADSRIIMDTTYGLQTTGIILFDIPERITNNNTLLTQGLHWLAATVDENSHLMPYLIKIVAQAIPATFKNQNNAPAHFQKPLPANSIARLVPKPAQVKKVEQPFETYDGVPAEVGGEFWMRVSERLHHKDRAIGVKDYEKLILEYFPQVFKVKVIGHQDPNCLCRKPQEVSAASTACCGPQVAPGHVMVIPIENLRNRNSVNMLQPKTSRRVMLEIEQFVRKRASPFVKVHVRNPVYEEVLTAFRVQFGSGVDKGYYLELLNEEIKKYLTPWVYDDYADVSFGGQIYASNVINFIEERPYVDFISDFMMFLVKCDCCPPKQPAKTSTAGGVSDEWDRIRSESIELDATILAGQIASLQPDGNPSFDPYERALLFEIQDWYQLKFGVQDSAVDFEMATLIEASSPRSLLVSAEKHVIMLYEEQKEQTTCAGNQVI